MGLKQPLPPEGTMAQLRAKAQRLLPRELSGKCDPSDIVQETLLEAHRDREQFRGASPQEYRSWLGAILKNAASRLRRRFQASQKRAVRRERMPGAKTSSGDFQAVLALSTNTPGTKAADRELVAIAEAALARLAPQQREIIRLRHEEDLGWDDIGARIGRTPGAARSLWYRAIDALREELGTAADWNGEP